MLNYFAPSSLSVPIISGPSQVDQQKIKHRHNKWSPSEDEKLRSLVISSNKLNWRLIALNIPNRNARQCQERWNYYLSPNVNNGEWTKEEDELLYEKYREFGTKWQQIAKFFRGRTNTNVKNRFLALERKAQRLESASSSSSSEDNIESASPAPKFIIPSILSLGVSFPSDFSLPIRN
ncbi:Myb-like DNA-binding domain containing protein [Trichomonas vaginalis G3]|uniref:Myb-like DNA-binding domain containing protein n=1 Tax=Trichomonas vaginalis (strain ATCC PRA-98 / G3) TaxID=412133 RepID=A2EUH7_TRIV3|nr:RNA polymerase II transcription regulator recruiting protein [Trichomonas vaginalis G3]EAY03679.1 Myb-like DNA-binding domain containing protein [Trichomonas vaginalis G3]KAI5532103.1 RNA polymerase II transcription regulator recruiting protein [Trichomonas vaginalis G3]|eukprot:XP_001315902.1 Myb-like DNA-binding domain containing protein [Trichomonas vaginalis G3]